MTYVDVKPTVVEFYKLGKICGSLHYTDMELNGREMYFVSL